MSRLIGNSWFVHELEANGSALLDLASNLAKAGARAGAVCQVLAAASVLFRAAQELKRQSFRAQRRSHSSDLPPLTARVPKEGGFPVLSPLPDSS